MDLSHVEKIADAVLYEGYILYPYRPSSVKNQQRWNFGALCPESYSLAQCGTESWTMQTECLVQGNPGTALNLKVRFLHLLEREVGQVIADCRLPTSTPAGLPVWGPRIAECGHFRVEVSDSHFALLPSLEVNGKLFQTWQEAVEREVSMPAVSLAETSRQAAKLVFHLRRWRLLNRCSMRAQGTPPAA